MKKRPESLPVHWPSWPLRPSPPRSSSPSSRAVDRTLRHAAASPRAGHPRRCCRREEDKNQLDPRPNPRTAIHPLASASSFPGSHRKLLPPHAVGLALRSRLVLPELAQENGRALLRQLQHRIKTGGPHRSRLHHLLPRRSPDRLAIDPCHRTSPTRPELAIDPLPVSFAVFPFSPFGSNAVDRCPIAPELRRARRRHC
jgi:hypothetical protein